MWETSTASSFEKQACHLSKQYFLFVVFWLLELVQFPATIVLLHMFSSVKFSLSLYSDFFFNYSQLAEIMVLKIIINVSIYVL